MSTVVFRPKPSLPRNKFRPVSCRRYASDDASKGSAEPRVKGPNMDQLPHVTEEQAALDKVMGENPPEIDEQGTPVSEVQILRSAAYDS